MAVSTLDLSSKLLLDAGASQTARVLEATWAATPGSGRRIVHPSLQVLGHCLRLHVATGYPDIPEARSCCQSCVVHTTTRQDVRGPDGIQSGMRSKLIEEVPIAHHPLT